MTRQKPQRDRSRILTAEGFQKLQARIREKEIQTGDKFTRQKISDLAGLHPDTVSKIFRCKEGVDRDSIRRLFSAFELELAESDLISTIQACSSQPEPNFVGRESAIAHLNTLVSQGKKVILIQAEGGVGKTTLAYRYLKTQGFDMVLELWMAKERQNITSVESVIEEWLKRYFDEEPGREFGVSLERLRCKLGDGSKKIGVLIDNLEPTLENGRFIEAHRRYAELLRILANPTVQSVTLITSRERLYEDGISIWLYPLSELPKEAWNQFFETCGINTGSSPLSDASALYQMHQAYGGNAEAMFVLSGAIQIECQGDLEDYWKENHEDLLLNPTLENLVKSQFNKLQQDDEQAYRLLCRLGCYRYQDVPSVPKEGIFYLLWDVPQEKRKRVVKALRDRSLVKVCNEEYYLHPVIRAEAVDRLRASEDWEAANQKSAEFWTQSVKTVETTVDALKALEAYYHYVEINNFEKAVNVILRDRASQSLEVFTPISSIDYTLGGSFIRLGLVQQIFFAIIQIIDNVNFGYPLSKIYNILADLYWLQGFLHKAIEYHEKSGQVASQCLKQISEEHNKSEIVIKLKTLSLVYLFYIGICKADLGEFEEAVDYLEKVMLLSQNAKIPRLAIQTCSNLASLNSRLNYFKKAAEFAEKAWREVSTTQLGVRSTGYRLFHLGLTYKNIGETERSFEMYNRALAYAEEIRFTQLKGISLTGLAELYRKEMDFKTALSNHSKSIEALDKIGAKCDIAEAYYQLGLTYQKMGDYQKSQESFDKAIQLFREMEAPRQVEKVRQAMESGE
ncbi:MAG TPA: tetratricopeptide repeat protein [Coleofasciculaceae cyanobacterium]|jgi:tetratricopeptide (TPR) repeat protein